MLDVGEAYRHQRKKSIKQRQTVVQMKIEDQSKDHVQKKIGNIKILKRGSSCESTPKSQNRYKDPEIEESSSSHSNNNSIYFQSQRHANGNNRPSSKYCSRTYADPIDTGNQNKTDRSNDSRSSNAKMIFREFNSNCSKN